MDGCEFTYENIIADKFDITLSVKDCQVESHRYCEIPISGPGMANRLVMITGIAVPVLDTADTSKYSGYVRVKTDYVLNPPDQWLGIVNGNDNLMQATYVGLASTEKDWPLAGAGDLFIFAVDQAWTNRNDDGRAQVNMLITLEGDITLHRIAYQANILVHKAK